MNNLFIPKPHEVKLMGAWQRITWSIITSYSTKTVEEEIIKKENFHKYHAVLGWEQTSYFKFPWGHSLYTDVYFSSFFSKRSASELERERRWRSINPPRISFLSRALDGIWRENRGSVNRLLSTLTLQAVATYISYACLQRKKRWTNSAVSYFCRVIYNINFFCIFHLQSWFRLYYFLLWTRIKTTRSLVLYKKTYLVKNYLWF